eukprot:g9525.t1
MKAINQNGRVDAINTAPTTAPINTAAPTTAPVVDDRMYPLLVELRKSTGFSMRLFIELPHLIKKVFDLTKTLFAATQAYLHQIQDVESRLASARIIEQRAIHHIELLQRRIQVLTNRSFSFSKMLSAEYRVNNAPGRDVGAIADGGGRVGTVGSGALAIKGAEVGEREGGVEDGLGGTGRTPESGGRVFGPSERSTGAALVKKRSRSEPDFRSSSENPSEQGRGTTTPTPTETHLHQVPELATAEHQQDRSSTEVRQVQCGLRMKKVSLCLSMQMRQQANPLKNRNTRKEFV